MSKAHPRMRKRKDLYIENQFKNRFFLEVEPNVLYNDHMLCWLKQCKCNEKTKMMAIRQRFP